LKNKEEMYRNLSRMNSKKTLKSRKTELIPIKNKIELEEAKNLSKKYEIKSLDLTEQIAKIKIEKDHIEQEKRDIQLICEDFESKLYSEREINQSMEILLDRYQSMTEKEEVTISDLKEKNLDLKKKLKQKTESDVDKILTRITTDIAPKPPIAPIASISPIASITPKITRTSSFQRAPITPTASRKRPEKLTRKTSLSPIMEKTQNLRR